MRRCAGLLLGVLLATRAAADDGREITLPDGRQMYLVCAGEAKAGEPVIVLVSGYHDSADPWLDPDDLSLLPQAAGPPVMPALAAGHRVCAYDRPGTARYIEGLPLTTRSTPVAQPRTVAELAQELHDLLDAAGISPPYLLVGHSLGGTITEQFGRAFPEETAGIVFVDALSPLVRSGLGARWPLYLAILNPAREAQPIPSMRAPESEVIDLDASFDALAALPPLRPIPLAVLTKTEPFRMPEAMPAGVTGAEIDAAYVAAQQFFVRQSPTTPQIFATGSEHYIQLSQPDLVVAAVRLVLGRVMAERR